MSSEVLRVLQEHVFLVISFDSLFCVVFTGRVRGLRKADDSFQGHTATRSAAVPPSSAEQYPTSYYWRHRDM